MSKYAQMILMILCGLILRSPTVRADDGAPQDAAISFARAYFQRWSSPNPVALDYMDSIFPDDVQYFGKDIDHKTLMDAKRRFAERWPERQFAERADSLHATCDELGLCTVWGIVDWRCHSEQRDATASGTSEFSFQVLNGKAVVAEDGFVVARGQALVKQQPEPAIQGSADADAGAVYPMPKLHPPAAQNAVQAAAGNQPGAYTINDIPGLRSSYLAHASDGEWISGWLLSEKTFNGTARSLGPAATYTLPEIHGESLHVIQFESSQGPIGCVMAGSTPAIAQGTNVRIHGAISFFVDRTMYLTKCEFT